MVARVLVQGDLGQWPGGGLELGDVRICLGKNRRVVLDNPEEEADEGEHGAEQDGPGCHRRRILAQAVTGHQDHKD